MSLKVKRRSVMSSATWIMASLSGYLRPSSSTMSNAKLKLSALGKLMDLRVWFSSSTQLTNLSASSLPDQPSWAVGIRTPGRWSFESDAMIMARKTTSLPLVAIMPCGVELL